LDLYRSFSFRDISFELFTSLFSFFSSKKAETINNTSNGYAADKYCVFIVGKEVIWIRERMHTLPTIAVSNDTEKIQRIKCDRFLIKKTEPAIKDKSAPMLTIGIPYW
jgi:hypothetical protein